MVAPSAADNVTIAPRVDTEPDVKDAVGAASFSDTV